MQLFEDRKDLEGWLERLDYQAFWRGVEPFKLSLLPRESCDRQIAAGIVAEKTVLSVLKAMARLELVERYDLRPRNPFRRGACH